MERVRLTKKFVEAPGKEPTKHTRTRLGVPVGEAATILTYNSKPSDMPGKLETRWYFSGAVRLATVEVYEKDKDKRGAYVVYITSRPGNGGSGFADEKALHRFLKEELLRDPPQTIRPIN